MYSTLQFKSQVTRFINILFNNAHILHLASRFWHLLWWRKSNQIRAACYKERTSLCIAATVFTECKLFHSTNLPSTHNSLFFSRYRYYYYCSERAAISIFISFLFLLSPSLSPCSPPDREKKGMTSLCWSH